MKKSKKIIRKPRLARKSKLKRKSHRLKPSQKSKKIKRSKKKIGVNRKNYKKSKKNKKGGSKTVIQIDSNTLHKKHKGPQINENYEELIEPIFNFFELDRTDNQKKLLIKPKQNFNINITKSELIKLLKYLQRKVKKLGEDDIRIDFYKDLEQVIEGLKGEIEGLKGENETLKQQIKQLNMRNEKNKVVCKAEEELLKQKNQKFNIYDKQIFEAKITKLKSALEQKNKEIEEIKKHLKAQIAKLKEQNEKLNTNNDALFQKLNKLQQNDAEKAVNKTTVSELKEQIQQKDNELTEINQQLTQEIEKLNQELTELKDECKVFQDFERFRHKHNNLLGAINDLTDVLPENKELGQKPTSRLQTPQTPPPSPQAPQSQSQSNNVLKPLEPLEGFGNDNNNGNEFGFG